MKMLIKTLEKIVVTFVLGVALCVGGLFVVSGTNSIALPKEDWQTAKNHFVDTNVGCPETGTDCLVIVVWG